jgi:hybrid cluster-associated redox disulfide protein
MVGRGGCTQTDLLNKERMVTITKNMSIGEVVQNYPDTIAVFFQHGLGCVGCAAARFENIEQGAKAHGIDVDDLIKALNAALSQPTTAAK